LLGLTGGNDIRSSGPGVLEGRKEVRTMLISTTILFTIVSAVAVGIVAGYAAIWGILTALGRRPAAQEPALVPVETAAGR
jgi:hypothetical protein